VPLPVGGGDFDIDCRAAAHDGRLGVDDEASGNVGSVRSPTTHPAAKT
jgi:hypothetical protein